MNEDCLIIKKRLDSSKQKKNTQERGTQWSNNQVRISESPGFAVCGHILFLSLRLK